MAELEFEPWQFGIRVHAVRLLIEIQCTEIQFTDFKIREWIQQAMYLPQSCGLDFMQQLCSKIFWSAVCIRILVLVRPCASLHSNVPGSSPIAKCTCICGPEFNFSICLLIYVTSFIPRYWQLACPPLENKASFSLRKASSFSTC